MRIRFAYKYRNYKKIQQIIEREKMLKFTIIQMFAL